MENKQGWNMSETHEERMGSHQFLYDLGMKFLIYQTIRPWPSKGHDDDRRQKYIDEMCALTEKGYTEVVDNNSGTICCICLYTKHSKYEEIS